jgi:uncharacterized protein YjbI with pentapeptide repeats
MSSSTWWHRIAVLFDLALIWTLWPLVAHRGSGVRKQRLPWPAGKFFARVLLTLVIGVIVLFVATFPGEQVNGFLAKRAPLVANAIAGLEERLFSCAYDNEKRSTKGIMPNCIVVANQDLAAFVPAGQMLHLEGRNLERAVLSGLTLRSVDFGDANLKNAEIRFVHMHGASFFRAKLEGASFEHSRLQGASFEQAEARSVDFSGVNLQGAKLICSQLQGADFREANLTGAWLDNAELQGANLSAGVFHGASLDETGLQGADLTWADLQGAYFRGAHLEAAKLEWAKLQGASLRGAHLEGTSLDGVSVGATDFRTAVLQQTRGKLILEITREPLPSIHGQGDLGLPADEKEREAKRRQREYCSKQKNDKHLLVSERFPYAKLGDLFQQYVPDKGPPRRDDNETKVNAGLTPRAASLCRLSELGAVQRSQDCDKEMGPVRQLPRIDEASISNLAPKGADYRRDLANVLLSIYCPKANSVEALSGLLREGGQLDRAVHNVPGLIDRLLEPACLFSSELTKEQRTQLEAVRKQMLPP